MTDEAQNTDNGKVVEVSEAELNDLGAFLNQVQIVLLGHEERLAAIEAFLSGPEDGETDGSISDEGDTTSSDRRAEVAGSEGEAIPSDEPTDSLRSDESS